MADFEALDACRLLFVEHEELETTESLRLCMRRLLTRPRPLVEAEDRFRFFDRLHGM